MGWHEIVDAACKHVERGFAFWVIQKVFSQHLDAPFEMIRVFGQAVSANPCPWPEHGPGDTFTLETVNASTYIIHIDPHCFTVERKFIHGGDLEVPERVFCGFCDFGSSCRHGYHFCLLYTSDAADE